MHWGKHHSAAKELCNSCNLFLAAEMGNEVAGLHAPLPFCQLGGGVPWRSIWWTQALALRATDFACYGWALPTGPRGPWLPTTTGHGLFPSNSRQETSPSKTPLLQAHGSTKNAFGKKHTSKAGIYWDVHRHQAAAKSTRTADIMLMLL